MGKRVFLCNVAVGQKNKKIWVEVKPCRTGLTTGWETKMVSLPRAWHKTPISSTIVFTPFSITEERVHELLRPSLSHSFHINKASESGKAKKA